MVRVEWGLTRDLKFRAVVLPLVTPKKKFAKAEAFPLYWNNYSSFPNMAAIEITLNTLKLPSITLLIIL